MPKQPQPTENFLCHMENPGNIVEIDDLSTCFFTDQGIVKAVDGISLTIPAGQTVGIVGESGCGKSALALSLMRLIQKQEGEITHGQIRFNWGKESVDILKLPTQLLRQLRGNHISMIFQDPMTCLNPVFRIGTQIDEVISAHNPQLSQQQIKQQTDNLLTRVGFSNSTDIYRMFPHQLSGGMCQRVMIAIAIAGQPRLIIADEPTTALDVTVQAQIIMLLQQLKEQTDTSILLITHDLGIIAQMADMVAVMYAGRIVEQGTVQEIFSIPAHPYTNGLLAAKPQLHDLGKYLPNIPGQVPYPIDLPNHCYFRDRCSYCQKICQGLYPKLKQLSPTHFVNCYFPITHEDKNHD